MLMSTHDEDRTCRPSNTSSERVFSQVRKIAPSFRSELGRDTLCALLSVKWNSDDYAADFKCTAKLLRSAKSYKYNQGHCSK